jgi:precorrin-2 dehydrogenase / sirohydrochlorin ferrochelatase
MIKVSDAYDWDSMCDFTDEDLHNLLKFYASNKVPTFEDLLGMRANAPPSPFDVFDGSFGFSVGA